MISVKQHLKFSELQSSWPVIIPCKYIFFLFQKYYHIIYLFVFLSFFYSARVPVLIDDGFKIYETEAITRYLVKKYQGKKNSTVLIPTDEKKAALVDQFISVGNSYYIPILFKLVDEELVVE